MGASSQFLIWCKNDSVVVYGSLFGGYGGISSNGEDWATEGTGDEVFGSCENEKGIIKIQNKGAKIGTMTPMDQVLWRTNLLEATLMGIIL
ncbi:hypothetical protein KY290_038371 [Solanum tuberosum]|uniref:Uncharacterized protein n=1 Tax=Solanum tuberosum TaxID=4113 RepID=A0ABQ7TZZ1_SOLTU|nr:hypothetical protein KY289_036452 [Solanum tuberosum]KAH0739666.1 hypothetical protein KY290_038371 [Solanum tuberosum]